MKQNAVIPMHYTPGASPSTMSRTDATSTKAKPSNAAQLSYIQGEVVKVRKSIEAINRQLGITKPTPTVAAPKFNALFSIKDHDRTCPQCGNPFVAVQGSAYLAQKNKLVCRRCTSGAANRYLATLKRK
jgi:hypothetical protein